MTIPVTTVEVRANRQDTLSRVADDLAHELKNPLNAVVVNLELLRRRVQDGSTDAALQRIDQIEQEVRKVNELLENLLQLLRPPKGNEAVVELDHVIQRLRPVIELQLRLAHVDFSIVLDAQGVPLALPRELLQQLVLNLILGALDGPRQGGTLRLETARSGTAAVLRVVDSGNTLAPGSLPGGAAADARVLRFAVTREIVESAGGRLEWGAPEGPAGGTTCTVTFNRSGNA